MELRPKSQNRDDLVWVQLDRHGPGWGLLLVILGPPGTWNTFCGTWFCRSLELCPITVSTPGVRHEFSLVPALQSPKVYTTLEEDGGKIRSWQGEACLLTAPPGAFFSC